MARDFHDRASIENALKRFELVCAELRGVLELIDRGKFTGRLYIQGEAELKRSKERLPLWVKNARGEALDAIIDPDGYQERMEKMAAESKEGEKNGTAKKAAKRKPKQ